MKVDKQNQKIPKELKVPKSKLKKIMYNLILDNQAREIKLLLFKLNKSIPSLYEDMQETLFHNNLEIAESTFKNMLMDSTKQRCNLDKRMKIIDLIVEHLDPDKIEIAYEGIKNIRNQEIRTIMAVLNSNYKDRREYTFEDTAYNRIFELPEDIDIKSEPWYECIDDMKTRISEILDTGEECDLEH
jgi:hypothetical protein